MASVAARVSESYGTPQDRIVEVLSAKAFCEDRGEMLPISATLVALAELTGLTVGELQWPLRNLMNLGQVITRIQKPSGELLYKMKDEHHDAWQSQNTKL